VAAWAGDEAAVRAFAEWAKEHAQELAGTALRRFLCRTIGGQAWWREVPESDWLTATRP
jgi:hypothetical protein